ncbi:DNA-binding protein [Nodosilinea sp. AN01ver1]|uniref:DNA-binding protein n=1 Tax=Nodosilinea sp. AN01ver1 TaxID=3423362 RepID=UPI003D317FC2
MRFFTTAALLTLGLGATFPAIAQIVPIHSLSRPSSTAIAGTVGSVVGNNFILSDGTSQIIVNAGPRWHKKLTIAPGEQVTVVGEYDNDELKAHCITRASGEVVTIGNGLSRAPWGSGASYLR